MPQEFLPYLLGLIQWARAQKKFSEWYYVGVLAVGSFAFAFIAHPNLFSLPFSEIVEALKTNLVAILAATQGVSTTANLINSSRSPTQPPHIAVPVTNSQP